jgi:4-amino-4-deoxy-L-arabinose transferase-like glycosyltransferase
MQKRSRQDWILLTVVGVGAVLRVRQFLFARSIWLDEATFANGVLESGWIDLVFRTQLFVDPIGYVFLTKLGAGVLGRTEFAFRWISLVAGVASILIAALLAKRIFETATARVSFTSFVALAPVLIYYSNEAQQYALDILAAVLVLWVFVSFEGWKRGFAVLVSTGVVFPFFSYASIIVLFGVGVSLAVRWLRDRSYRKLAITGSTWGLSALIVLVHARMVSRNEFLEEYWTSGFAPFPIGSFEDLRWYPESVAGMVETAWFAEGFVPAEIASPSLASWLILGLVVVGAVLLTRRRPWIALALGAMFVSSVGASALGQYPFGSRPGLYMVPLLYLLAVEPIDWAMKRPSLGWRAPAVLVAVALALTLAVPSFRLFVDPENPSDMHGALTYVVENREPGDDLIVHGWSSRAFSFYAPRFDIDEDMVGEVPRDFDVGVVLGEIGSEQGLGRTWLVFSHRVREAERLVEELADVAPLLDRSGDGTYLVALFDLSDLP